jgi:hypothetical protein
MFFSTLAWPSAQARRAKIRSIGYGLPSDFELNFGRYLPALGRADDDDTDSSKSAETASFPVDSRDDRIHRRSGTGYFAFCDSAGAQLPPWQRLFSSQTCSRSDHVG